jgi:hypothetical protein
MDREVEDVLAGRARYDDITTDAQAVVRDAWATTMDERRLSLDLVAEFMAAGRSYAALDEGGQLVRYAPDGTEHEGPQP